MSEDEAKNTTVLEYAIFVGGQQLFSDMDKKELEQLYLFHCQNFNQTNLNDNMDKTKIDNGGLIDDYLPADYIDSFSKEVENKENTSPNLARL